MKNTDTLSFEVIKRFPDIDHSHPELRFVDEIVSWRKPLPDFRIPGRTAWLPLDQPFTISTKQGQVEIKCLKIKGAGLYDFNGNTHPPGSESFQDSSMHMKINREGFFELIRTAPKPLGGLALQNAEMDYHVGYSLLEQGLPTQIPICVYKYNDPQLKYKMSDGRVTSLGVSVSGLFHQDLRGDIGLEYSTTDDETREHLNIFAQKTGVDLSANPELRITKRVYQSIGCYIRKFCECGLYRHSSYLDNVGLSSSIGDIYFTDVDSCQRLSQCSDIEKPLQIIRDAMSAIYHLALLFTENRNIDRFIPEDVFDEKLIETYLVNYYYDVPAEMIDASAQIIQQEILFIYHSIMRNKTHKKSMNSVCASISSEFEEGYEERWGRAETNYERLFSVLFALFFCLHERSEISTAYPLSFNRAELFKRLTMFSGSEVIDEVQKKTLPLYKFLD